MNAKHASAKLNLEATKREVTGHAVKRLRAEGLVPAVLYGRGMESVSLQVPARDFERVFRAAGESTLVYLKVGSQEYPTLITDASQHPLSGAYQHADFHKVRLDEKIKAMVPVVFVGVSPAVKDEGGMLVRNVNELEVEALPTDLPHEIEIDISALKSFSDHITLASLKPHGWVFTGEADEVLATVQAPKSQEELDAELAAPTTDISAVEEIKKEKVEGEEGEEAPAEGAAPAAPAAEEKKE
jgi:large subunit ribosomal protein L25